MSFQRLTSRQKQILAYIAGFIKKHSFPPTRSDISRHFGFRSANAAECHLRALAAKGAIKLQAGLSRGISITDLYTDSPAAEGHLPLVGQVAAGSPIMAVENIDGDLPVPSGLFKPKPDYLLRVRGESMLEAGILDGDLLVVHKTRLARNRQIVVARIDGYVTVKRFFQTENRIRLEPENPDYEALEIDPDKQEFVIEGLGVGVLRTGLSAQ